MSNKLSTHLTSDTQVGVVDGVLSSEDPVKEQVTQNTKALSKWRKVTNTIKFINVSKNCVVKPKARKHSKWTIVRIAFSAVNFLIRKTKNEQLHKKVRVQCNIIIYQCSLLQHSLIFWLTFYKKMSLLILKLSIRYWIVLF